MLSAVKNLSLA